MTDFVFKTMRKTPLKWVRPSKSQRIMAETAAKHGVTLTEISGYSRKPKIVTARWHAISRLRNELRMSLAAIGRIVNRHHTTVLYALRNMEEREIAAALEGRGQ